jgi:hypothetical protein
MNESVKKLREADSRMIMQLSVEELRQIIRDEVAKHGGSTDDRLVDIEEAARILNLSVDWLYHNRKTFRKKDKPQARKVLRQWHESLDSIPLTSNFLSVQFGYHERQGTKTATEAFENDTARACGGARAGQKHSGACRAGCDTDSKSNRVSRQVFAHRGIQKEEEKKKMRKMVTYSEAVTTAIETGDTGQLKELGKAADVRIAVTRAQGLIRRAERLQKKFTAESQAPKTQPAKGRDIEPEFTRVADAKIKQPAKKFYGRRRQVPARAPVVGQVFPQRPCD